MFILKGNENINQLKHIAMAKLLCFFLSTFILIGLNYWAFFIVGIKPIYYCWTYLFILGGIGLYIIPLLGDFFQPHEMQIIRFAGCVVIMIGIGVLSMYSHNINLLKSVGIAFMSCILFSIAIIFFVGCKQIKEYIIIAENIWNDNVVHNIYQADIPNYEKEKAMELRLNELGYSKKYVSSIFEYAALKNYFQEETNRINKKKIEKEKMEGKIQNILETAKLNSVKNMEAKIC
ncbi:MAG: hypothetical protein K2P99_04730 [Burkholderiales bacterium]|nr:hypothetical protein [Burkholderiales bacterium]